MSEALKPCPFCGGEAIEHEPQTNAPFDKMFWVIQCTNCCARIGGTHRRMNREAWNRRDGLGSIKLRALREALKLIKAPVVADNIPHLTSALQSWKLCDESGNRVYVWKILAMSSKEVRGLYQVGKKGYNTLVSLLRSNVGDALVDEWLQEE